MTPQVVTYRLAYGPRWWPEFVEDFTPQWLVQRGQIADFTTYQGYRLSAEEQDWFRAPYDLVARGSFARRPTPQIRSYSACSRWGKPTTIIFSIPER